MIQATWAPIVAVFQWLEDRLQYRVQSKIELEVNVAAYRCGSRRVNYPPETQT